MKIISVETGASMIEYALLLSLISAAAIVSLQVLGSSVNQSFDTAGLAFEGSGGVGAGTTQTGEQVPFLPPPPRP